MQQLFLAYFEEGGSHFPKGHPKKPVFEFIIVSGNNGGQLMHTTLWRV